MTMDTPEKLVGIEDAERDNDKSKLLAMDDLCVRVDGNGFKATLPHYTYQRRVVWQ